MVQIQFKKLPIKKLCEDSVQESTGISKKKKLRTQHSSSEAANPKLTADKENSNLFEDSGDKKSSANLLKDIYKEVPQKEVNSRFYCLSGDCELNGQSFSYVGGLHEHYMEKHAREDQKHFPCQFCPLHFGTMSLLRSHNQTHDIKVEHEKNVWAKFSSSRGYF